MIYHKPVLLNETIDALNLAPGKVIVDCTLGGGGHSEAILEKISPTGTLIGFDRDPDAIEEVSKRLSKYNNKILINNNYSEIKSELAHRQMQGVDGILFDCGVSSHQLDTDRGFSFLRDEVLDMRMSREGITAAHYVNTLPEEELANIIYKYGEERYSRRVARAICEERKNTVINSTLQLADLISKRIGREYKKEKIHPATRTFQALRILVNDELSSIETALQDAIDLLNTGGIIAVISFHSLEDRIVKNIFKYNNGQCKCPKDLPICVCKATKKIEIITKKPIVPTEAETINNPRAKSSKLRVGKKI
ncbi:MAG: 16S rRNA (cytosine(1402)-N(4))-methyltransferase RsmH [Abditibacteriota bacterium]|nr:16S rRNA (cytosine(1402)-N(4))-methyltransferase RsmH [Abditibacteriota bacterium]